MKHYIIFLTCIVIFITNVMSQDNDTLLFKYQRYDNKCDTVILDEVIPTTKKFYNILDSYISDFNKFEEYKNSNVILTKIDAGSLTFVDFHLVTSFIEYELWSPKHLLYGCFFYKDKLVIVYEWREISTSIALLFRYTGKKYQFIYNPEEPVEDETIYHGKCWVFRYMNGKFHRLKYSSNTQRYQ